jgi:acetyl-CoA carboxylase carboxyl transferase subunit alpha
VSNPMADFVLPFEEKLVACAKRLETATGEEERLECRDQYDFELASVYSRITAWQRVQLARHPQRPRMMDYVPKIFEDFVELHGDRLQEDDPAMICGLARFQGQTVFLVGQQKGVGLEEQMKCNFGMAHPSGYRKALRIFKMAERLGYPIVTFVDTPAAHPGVEAEESGQGVAIAENLLALTSLDTPMLTIVLSEGGSGGAIAIAVADWVSMFEYAVYMICPPERCAEILWRDVERKDEAATALKITAGDLKDLGIIDRVLREGYCASHHGLETAAQSLTDEIAWFLDECKKGAWTIEKRQKRFQGMGQWIDGPCGE